MQSLERLNVKSPKKPESNMEMFLLMIDSLFPRTSKIKFGIGMEVNASSAVVKRSLSLTTSFLFLRVVPIQPAIFNCFAKSVTERKVIR